MLCCLGNDLQRSIQRPRFTLRGVGDAAQVRTRTLLTEKDCQGKKKKEGVEGINKDTKDPQPKTLNITASGHLDGRDLLVQHQYHFSQQFFDPTALLAEGVARHGLADFDEVYRKSHLKFATR